MNWADSTAHVQMLIDAGERNGWNGMEMTSNWHKLNSA